MATEYLETYYHTTNGCKGILWPESAAAAAAPPFRLGKQNVYRAPLSCLVTEIMNMCAFDMREPGDELELMPLYPPIRDRITDLLLKNEEFTRATNPLRRWMIWRLFDSNKHSEEIDRFHWHDVTDLIADHIRLKLGEIVHKH